MGRVLWAQDRFLRRRTERDQLERMSAPGRQSAKVFASQVVTDLIGAGTLIRAAQKLHEQAAWLEQASRRLVERLEKNSQCGGCPRGDSLDDENLHLPSVTSIRPNFPRQK